MSFLRAFLSSNLKDLISPQSALTNPNGLLGNIINTLYIILGTLLLACPIGIGGAIYLNEYTKIRSLLKLLALQLKFSIRYSVDYLLVCLG